MNALPLPSPAGDAAKLAEILQDAVDMLRRAEVIDEAMPVPVRMEPSLLQQCLDLCRDGDAGPREPVRTIHHFACAGGTLFSKCVAAMPNVQLLSEIDPLSVHGRRSPQPVFAPSDMATLLAQGTRATDRQGLIELFQAQMRIAYSQTVRKGGYLVLRDHTHSHFCSDHEPDVRPTLREMLAQSYEVLSVITVRDPVDSFMSLRRNGWINFQPATFDGYCHRYLNFLDRYADCPRVKYEDFLRDPKTVMREVCDILSLPYIDTFGSLFSVFKLTGDSGRSGSRIEARESLPVPAELRAEFAGSANYARLAERLGYENKGTGNG